MKKDNEIVYGEPLLTSAEDNRCYDSIYESYKYSDNNKMRLLSN